MKKEVLFGLLCVAITIGAGCNGANTNVGNQAGSGSVQIEDSSIESSVDEQVEDEEEDVLSKAEAYKKMEESPDFNHGHTISEAGTDRPREVDRSYDLIIHDEDEALAYLKDCLGSLDSKIDFVLTDTSENDPGAYMWYEFTPTYDSIKVNGAQFRVVAFTDGSLVEGRPEVFTASFSDRSSLLGSDEALKLFNEQYNDKREYKYQDEYYIYGGGDSVRYVYVYRFENGKVLENTTLGVDATTGDMVMYRPDAID